MGYVFISILETKITENNMEDVFLSFAVMKVFK